MKTEKTEINLDELKRGGIVKLKEKDMFSVWIKAVCDNMDAQKLCKVADLAEKYGKGLHPFLHQTISNHPSCSFQRHWDSKG